MRNNRLLSGLIVCSMTGFALPAGAETVSSRTPQTQSSAPSAFKASVDRAVACVLVDDGGTSNAGDGLAMRMQKRPTRFATEGAGGQSGSGGGGGSHITSLIVTLVGTAAGVGATIYMLKELRKVQTPAAK